MSYTDLRDFECEYVLTQGDLMIEIEKLGGGTVGQAYTGQWRYVVKVAGREAARAQDVNTGMPHTHADVAALVANVFDGTDAFSWEVGHNIVGSPREAAATYDTWQEAADAIRDLARDYADNDDESRDDDEDENTRAIVDSMLSPVDGVGPERSEDSAWAMWVEESSGHRIEFWIRPATS